MPRAAVLDAGAGFRDRLRGIAEDGAERVVLVSSAAVYGAWPDNPVPLTEDAPLRPNPGCALAAACAEAERVAQDWRIGAPGRELVILRPARLVPAREARPVRGAGAPTQYLHPDDLAQAVEFARTADVAGVYNVAPDGWVSPETARSLVHGPFTVPVPERVARARSTRSVAARADLAYRVHPWVVANDRLRAAGWEPAHTNEEAWVLTHRPSAFLELSADRRQQVALAATGGAIATVGAAIAAAVRLRRRRA